MPGPGASISAGIAYYKPVLDLATILEREQVILSTISRASEALDRQICSSRRRYLMVCTIDLGVGDGYNKA